MKYSIFDKRKFFLQIFNSIKKLLALNVRVQAFYSFLSIPCDTNSLLFVPGKEER